MSYKAQLRIHMLTSEMSAKAPGWVSILWYLPAIGLALVGIALVLGVLGFAPVPR